MSLKLSKDASRRSKSENMKGKKVTELCSQVQLNEKDLFWGPLFIGDGSKTEEAGSLEIMSPTLSRAKLPRKDWKEIVILPRLRSLHKTKMAALTGLKRKNTLSPMKSNSLRIIDGFSFALLFNQFNEVLIMRPSVRIQITRHNFVTNHHTRSIDKSGTVFTVARETVLTTCICWVNIERVWSYFESRNTLKTLAKIEHASGISA